MVLGLLVALRECAPQAKLYLLSDMPDVDTVRYGQIPGLELVERPWRKQDRSVFTVACIALSYGFWFVIGVLVTKLPALRRFWKWDSVGQAYSDAKVAMDVSGDDFTTVYGLTSPLQLLYEMAIAKLFGNRTVALAQSVGPFDNGVMICLGRTLDLLSDVITFRDNESRRYWRFLRRKIDSTLVGESESVDDLSFLINIPKQPYIDKGPIIVNLSNYVVDATIGVRKGHSGSALTSYLSNWVSVLCSIHEITSREILLFPHVFRSGRGDDRYYLSRLNAMCPSDLPVTYISDTNTAYETQRFVSTSSFVIASRMHLALSSIAHRVPFLALAYSHKYTQLYREGSNQVSPVMFVKQYSQDQIFSELEKRFSDSWHSIHARHEMLCEDAAMRAAGAQRNVTVLSQILQCVV